MREEDQSYLKTVYPNSEGLAYVVRIAILILIVGGGTEGDTVLTLILLANVVYLSGIYYY